MRNDARCVFKTVLTKSYHDRYVRAELPNLGIQALTSPRKECRMNATQPLAYTVRQCKVCRGIYSWPILDMADACALQYLHCGQPTDYIETRPVERESVSCEEVAE